MARKRVEKEERDKSLVVVANNLTDSEANRFLKKLITLKKNTLSDDSRFTAAVTKRDGIKEILQEGRKMITGRSKE